MSMAWRERGRERGGMALPDPARWIRSEAPGSASAAPPEARGRKAEGGSRAICDWRADLAPHTMSVLEGDEGGSLVQNELSGHQPIAPTTMCGTAPPKPRLWIYEKEALVPQPESGLALFSSLEGGRTWFGGKVCRSLSVSHPRLGELEARLDCCRCRSFGRGRRGRTGRAASEDSSQRGGVYRTCTHLDLIFIRERAHLGQAQRSVDEQCYVLPPSCAARILRRRGWGRHLTTCPPGGQATLESVDHWPMANPVLRHLGESCCR